MREASGTSGLGGIRTPDHPVKSRTLYLAKLQALHGTASLFHGNPGIAWFSRDGDP
jgi:hypothetical protein